MTDETVLTERLGLKRCDLPGFEHVWVQFRTSGYPFRLRREWDAADGRQTIAIVLRYVEAWNLPDVDGQVVPLPDGERTLEVIDGVEDRLVPWLVKAFKSAWLFDLTNARPNSSAPSPST